MRNTLFSLVTGAVVMAFACDHGSSDTGTDVSGGAPATGATGGVAAGSGASGSGTSGSGGVTMTTGGSGGTAGTSDAGEAGAISPGGGEGGANPNLYVFLLIGQSNMVGQPPPAVRDRELDPHVQVLAYDNCPNLSRTYNEWYTASPPLHNCNAGLGPGDYFGKTLAAAYPQATIGLVPCAISGVDIDFFRKGVTSTRRSEFRIPPDDHWDGAYEWVIERARLAQQAGVIRGIIFHQGESDTGQAVWVDKVKEMVTDLRADLELGDAPFLAGELLYGGCCSSHNPLVNQLPSQITNSYVISASGLMGTDGTHFDLEGQREFGTRYGQKMIEVLP